MSRVMRKYGKPVMIPIVGILGGIMVFTSFNRGGGLSMAKEQQNTPPDRKVVATTGDRTIFSEDVERAIKPEISQYEMMGNIVPADQKDGLRLRALQSFQQEAALRKIAQTKGIKTTPESLVKERKAQWESGRGQLLSNLELPLTASDAQIDEVLKAKNTGLTVALLQEKALTDDVLTTAIYKKTIEEEIKKGIVVDAASVRRGYNNIRLRKIVIPFGDGKTTEDAARAKAQKLLDDVKLHPETMATVATNNSADVTKKTGGLSDSSQAQSYDPAITEAAFKAGLGKICPELVRLAQPGELGFAIIKLEEEKPNPKNLPPDFEKNTLSFVSAETNRRVGGALMAQIQAVLPTVPINITDPMLKSASLMMDAMRPGANKNQLLQDALNLVAKIDPKTDPESIAPLRKAQICLLMGKQIEAISAYRAALKERNLIDTRIKFINLLIESKQLEDAKKELLEVEKMAVPRSQDAYSVSKFYMDVKDTVKSREWAEKGGQMAKRESERLSERLGTQVPGASTQIPAPSVPKQPVAPKK
jgi:PPIC-type PPIASE domain/SurA N-terminal domain